MKQVFLTEHLLFYFFVLKPIYVLNPVDWSGRHEDSSENANAFPSCVGKFKDAQSMSCGISKSWEAPQVQKAPRRLAECKKEFDF